MASRGLCILLPFLMLRRQMNESSFIASGAAALRCLFNKQRNKLLKASIGSCVQSCALFGDGLMFWLLDP